MKQRPGYMLIEMLVVIAVGSVMMGIAVSILYMLMRMDGQSRQSARELSGLARLAEQFRTDVHASTAWVPLDQPSQQGVGHSGWRLRCIGNRDIEYHAAPGMLRRTERAGGQVQRQESYHLPAGAIVAIQSSDEADPVILRLCIVPDRNMAAKPGVRRRSIEAVLGKNDRYAESLGMKN